MSSLRATAEHEFEAEHGLPEHLPEGEQLLWQGAPDARDLARRAFHARKLAVYFGALALLRGADVWSQGRGPAEALRAGALLCVLGAAALAIVHTIAWLAARSTVYTLTDRRIVMRIGIVLSLSLNLPLRCLDSATLRAGRDGDTGDIALGLSGVDRIAYLHLWPHARPWKIGRPQPMLRSLPDADFVATLLGNAWQRATGRALSPATLPSTVEAPPPLGVGEPWVPAR